MALPEQLRVIAAKFRDEFVIDAKKKLFVSYSSQDRQRAHWICVQLQNHGFAVWVDRIEIAQRALTPDLELRLFEGIRNADGIVVLLSKTSTRSEWVKKEYREAIRLRDSGVPLSVFPAIIEDCEIPPELGRVIDFRAELHGGILDIIASVGSLSLERRRAEPYVSSRPYHYNLGSSTQKTAMIAYNEGLRYYQRQDMRTALEKWELALELDPDFVDALYNSAVLLWDQAMQAPDEKRREQLLDDVISRYELVLNKKPEDVDAMINLGVAYRESTQHNNLAREGELLLRAYTLTPDYGLVWLNLGHHCAVLGGVKRVADAIKQRSDNIIAAPEKLEFAKWCYMKAGAVDAKMKASGDLTRFILVMDQVLSVLKPRWDWGRPLHSLLTWVKFHGRSLVKMVSTGRNCGLA